MTRTIGIPERQLQVAAEQFGRLRRAHPDVASQLLVITTRERLSPQLSQQIAENWRMQVGNRDAPIQFREDDHVGPADIHVRSEADGDRTEMLPPAPIGSTYGWDPRSRVVSIQGDDASIPFNFLLQPGADGQWSTIFGGFDKNAKGTRLMAGSALPEQAVIDCRLDFGGSGGSRLLLRNSGSVPSLTIEMDGRVLPPHSGTTVEGDNVYAVLTTTHPDGRTWRTLISTRPVSQFTLELGVQQDLRREVLDIDHPGGFQVQVDGPAQSGGHLRDFAIVGPTGGASTLDASVITTTGRGQDRQWHVKIYRCATRGHAEALRGFLNHQTKLLGSAPSPYLPEVVIAGLDSATPTMLAPDPEAGSGLISQSTDTGRGLAGWFGVPSTGDLSAYVAVLSPALQQMKWHVGDSELRNPPQFSLSRFDSMAKALDALHDAGVAHGDIKSDNVCLRGDQEGKPLALVDADSVIALRANPRDARATWSKAAPGLIRAKRGQSTGDPAVLRTNDRFAFALLILQVMIDNQTFRQWTPQTFPRPVDNIELVRAHLRAAWGPQWNTLIVELTNGLDERYWRDDQRRLYSWLESVATIPPGGVPAVIPPESRSVYARQHDELRSLTTEYGREGLLTAISSKLSTQAQDLAVENWWRIYRFGALVIGVVMAVLVCILVLGVLR